MTVRLFLSSLSEQHTRLIGYNIAAVFAFIAIDFGQNVSGLGVLTASFYIGLGLFQIPGGIVAGKFGPRKTAIYGMLLSSAAAALTAFTFQFYQLVLLRFLVGVGMGLFFGPGVTLIAKAFRGESQGLGVGVFNGAFYVGSALGLFGCVGSRRVNRLATEHSRKWWVGNSWEPTSFGLSAKGRVAERVHC